MINKIPFSEIYRYLQKYVSAKTRPQKVTTYLSIRRTLLKNPEILNKQNQFTIDKTKKFIVFFSMFQLIERLNLFFVNLNDSVLPIITLNLHSCNFFFFF